MKRPTQTLVQDHETANRWRQAAKVWPRCFVCGAEPLSYFDYTDGTVRCGRCRVTLLAPPVGYTPGTLAGHKN